MVHIYNLSTHVHTNGALTNPESLWILFVVTNIKVATKKTIYERDIEFRAKRSLADLCIKTNMNLHLSAYQKANR